MAVYHCPGCGDRIPYNEKVQHGIYPNIYTCKSCYDPPLPSMLKPGRQFRPLKHASKAPIDATVEELDVDDLNIGR